MNFYVYNASVYCVPCGELIKNNLFDDYRDENGEWLCVKARKDTGDSDTYPQGPYPSAQGEADTPSHCGRCGLFLENPLTEDGKVYVSQAFGTWGEKWRKFYNIPMRRPRGQKDKLQAALTLVAKIALIPNQTEREDGYTYEELAADMNALIDDARRIVGK